MIRKASAADNDRIDALAAVTDELLRARGQTDNPTMHDITLAAAQIAPLLNITMPPDATHIILAAANKLVHEHNWDIGKVVLLKDGFAKDRRQRNRLTTTAHPVR